MIAKVPSYSTPPATLPFSTNEWVTLWHQTIGKDWELVLLTIDNVIAPLARKGNTLILAGGYEVADYLDLVGPEEEKVNAWEEITHEFRGMHLVLRNVPETSATVKYFHMEKEDTTPKILLPGSWEEYLATLTRKYRHELDRKIRKVEREHVDVSFRQSDNPGQDISILLELMEKDRKKQKFLTPEMKTFFTEMAKTFSNQISLLILSIGDKHSAAILSFVVEEKQYLYNSGFDKTCCQNGGFYLKAQSIKRAIEQGFKEYNFLQGSERYKYELGGRDFGVHSINWHLTA